MQKFLLISALALAFIGCSTPQTDTQINSDTTVETPNKTDAAQISNEVDTNAFTFGKVNYELDYPSSWTYAEETYDTGGAYTQFYDESKGKTMMVDCDFQGGMEAEVLKTDERNFEKQGESVKVRYAIFGTQDSVGNGNISLGLTEWSEETSKAYYCQIFFQPSVAEKGIVEEIFASIR